MDKLKRHLCDGWGVPSEVIDDLLNYFHEEITSLDKKDKTRVIIENWEDEPNITENVVEFILIARTGMDLAVIGSHSKSFGLLALNKLKKILQESDWER